MYIQLVRKRNWRGPLSFWPKIHDLVGLRKAHCCSLQQIQWIIWIFNVISIILFLFFLNYSDIFSKTFKYIPNIFSTFLSSLLTACFHIILPSKSTQCSLTKYNFQNFPGRASPRIPQEVRASGRSFGPSSHWIAPFRGKTCLRLCILLLVVV